MSSNDQVTSSNHYVTSSSHQVTTKKKIKIMAKLNTFDFKTSISPLIPGKFGPKKEIYS